MPKGRESASPLRPARSKTLRRDPSQTVGSGLNPTQNHQYQIPRDRTNHAGPSAGALGPESAASATSTTAQPRPRAESPMVSAPQTASRVPATNLQKQEMQNHGTARGVVVSTQNHSNMRHNENAGAPRGPSPPQAPLTYPSSSGSGPASVGGSSLKRLGNYPWLDGPDYNNLYKAIKHQSFNGYKCIEEDMVQQNYRIPASSITWVSQYLEGKNLQDLPHAATLFGPEHCIGFGKSDFLGVLRRQEGLTLGEAIQKLYMARLRESNKYLPMTKVYEEDWNLELEPPRRPHPKRVGTVWLGDVVDSVNFKLLKEKNITAMVSIHPKDFRSKGQEKHGTPKSSIRWHHRLELADSKEADMESKFKDVFAFIQDNVVEGHNVLVHCIAGLSRSVAVVRYFIQCRELEGKKNLPSTLEEKERLMTSTRNRIFKDLKTKRPGITGKNFGVQLDNSLRQLYELDPISQPKGSEQKSEEHGGGGYIGDAVAMVFFLYRLRPTPKVIELFETRRKKYESMEKLPDQNQEGFSFPEQMIKWFEGCTKILSPGP